MIQNYIIMLIIILGPPITFKKIFLSLTTPS